MSKKLIAILAVIALLLLVAIPASAVVWGQPDGDDHPYVGVVLLPLGGGWWRVCSGTLLNETVFLTAGHCTDGFDNLPVAIVTFDSEGPFQWVGGTPHTHPDFNWFETFPFPNNYDVGVVILSESVYMDEYGQLPDIGEVDELKVPPGPPQLLTIVGYGVQGTVPHPQEFTHDLIRYNANPQLIEVNSAYAADSYMRLSTNPGQGGGTGGACFGDSGGPALFEGNKIAGVGSAGKKFCTGNSLYYRVDTEDAQNFIRPFLGQ